jgi:DNA-directed RNA polymerase I subunit RPA49
MFLANRDGAYDLYERGNSKMLVMSDRIEFVGREIPTECDYYVAVYSKETQFHKTLPMHVRPLIAAEDSRLIKKDFAARQSLGQAFGTRKRRQLIAAQEMNQVDVSVMQDVQHSVTTKLSESIANVPSKQERSQLNTNIIPPVNLDAPSAALVYPIEGIIPPDVAAAIDVSEMRRMRLIDEVKAYMAPLYPTSWVWARIESWFTDKEETEKLDRVLLLTSSFICRVWSVFTSSRLASSTTGALL